MRRPDAYAAGSWSLPIRRALAAGAFALLAASAFGQAADVPGYITAAVVDPARPDKDIADDFSRKPAETVAVAGVKPGDKVADILPGGGYYTRILSKVVGPKGKVYSVVSLDRKKDHPDADAAPNAIAANPAFSNVTVMVSDLRKFSAPEKLEVVWTSRNYHDFHNPPYEPGFTAAFDKAVFNALKPGGIFFVLDHGAEPGSGLRDTVKLHRIDPAAVKAEVLAAGFVLDGESDILRNPRDVYSDRIFDGAVQGHTDQFIFRFRKPRGKKK